MRMVEIGNGECTVYVDDFPMRCPVCRALVCAGIHRCLLRAKIDAVATNGGKATVETLQPHKGAK